MNNAKWIYYDSKEFPLLGRIYAAWSEKGLCRLSLPAHPVESFFERILKTFQPNFFTQNPEPFQALYRQLTQYLAGERHLFDIPLDMRGTAFQLEVWQALEKIPYGQTRSYGEIAALIGKPKSSRAVGQANHNNPLPVLVPCHRVIGSLGDLVGYGGGISTKKRLLDLEKKFSLQFQSRPL
jgi:O-6-methylguanine DNA methyltransferase